MATPNGNPCGSIGGIPFEEAEGSGKTTFTRDSARGTRIFFIDWNDRIEFAKQVTGFFVGEGDEAFQQDPITFPDYPALEAKNATTTGWGKMVQQSDPTYLFAKVEVTYEPKVEAENDQEKIIRTEELDISSEFLNFGKLKLAWVNGDEDAIPIESEEVLQKTRLVVTIKHTITETESPKSRKIIASDTQGSVNDDIFLEVEAGKLLYMGAQQSRVITADGGQPFRVVHTFLERPEAAWNLFFRDDAVPPAYEAVQLPDGVDPVTVGVVFNQFPSADFNLLID